MGKLKLLTIYLVELFIIMYSQGSIAEMSEFGGKIW
jgi:hypothetical protein|tara:strand:- start:210 stop:317 length:108 start_codon:yes stop_codon:yes gene_type:complete